MHSHHYNKAVGWEGTIQHDANYQYLWSPERLTTIQRKITELLQGVEPSGRPILVPVETIGNVLYQCYNTNRPATGDIFSKYIITPDQQRNDATQIINRTINIIVTQIRNEYEMNCTNKNLTVWNTVLGDFNKEGLRAHPPIKIRKRRSERMQFHMNY